ncbi:MAG: ABC transporter substrate-binding protein, partial [Thermomicrobiales bacterium]
TDDRAEAARNALSRRRLIQLSGAGAGASLLAAHGQSAAARQDAAGSPVAGANPFGEPTTQGGIYTVAGVGSGVPRNFIPTSYFGTTPFYHCKLIYTPLIILDRSWQEFSPALATDWSWSDDDLQLTLSLRDDVTFHDGEAFTAEDVVFTYQLMVRADRAPAVQDISILQGAPEFKEGTTDEFPGVEAIDDLTVRFNLSAPSGVFLHNISNCGILPAHAFPAEALAAGGAVEEMPFYNFEAGPPFGTGPWKVADYNPETNIRLEANPDYFKGRPILDGITMLYGITGPAGISGIQAGEFDGYYVGAAFQDIRVLDESGQFEMLFDYDLANEQVLIVATEKEYMSVPVRQALLTAIDTQTLIDAVSFGYARPAPAIMMHPSLFPNENLPEYTYDPERARELLAEGGWDESRTLKVGQFVAEGQPNSILAALMDMWLEAGIQTEFTPLDPANQVEIQRSEDHPYDFTFQSYAWLAYNPSSTYSNFACERRPNHANYCNPDYDAALQAAIRTLDPAAATALYQQAQTILQTELPYAPIWIEPATWAFTPRLHGGNMGRGPLNDVLSELWWKE